LASDLRKEYQNNAVTKTSRDVKTQWAKVKEVMDNPSAAGDMAAIFMFMKTLDPGSTVREGEYKSAAEATSALGRVQTSLLQAKSGDKLNPAQRADFRKVMEKFYRAQMKEQARVNKQYSDLAGRQGINPADLMIEDVDSVQSEPGTPRKVRSVNDLPDVR
jgi:ribosomal protein L20A (L18A)